MDSVVRHSLAVVIILASCGTVNAEIAVEAPGRSNWISIMTCDHTDYLFQETSSTEDLGPWDDVILSSTACTLEARQSSTIVASGDELEFSGLVSTSYDRQAPGDCKDGQVGAVGYVSFRPELPTVLTYACEATAGSGLDNDSGVQIRDSATYDVLLELSAGEIDGTLELEAGHRYKINVWSFLSLASSDPVRLNESCEFLFRLAPAGSVATDVSTWSAVRSLFR